MVWATATSINSSIGVQQAAALGLTSGSQRLTDLELEARALVQSAIQHAGYNGFTETLDESSESAKVTAAFLRSIVVAIIVKDALLLEPGIELPEPVDERINRTFSRLEAVYQKRLPIPNVQPTTAQVGLGGVKFTSALTMDAACGAQSLKVFSRGKLWNF